MRRDFFQFHASTKSPLAAEVSARVAALYAIEAEIRGHPAEHRRRMRQERSRPIVDALHAWLLDHVDRITAASDLAKAMRYAIRHWRGLIAVLDDGRIEMDTNVVERGHRPAYARLCPTTRRVRLQLLSVQYQKSRNTRADLLECAHSALVCACLLQLALGIVLPWSVTGSDFDADARRLDIHIDFSPGSRFACPSCDVADCPAYDAEHMTCRHLNFFQHQAYLHARAPRVRCAVCGVKKITVPWTRPDSSFTLLFEALLMSPIAAMPVNTVARLVVDGVLSIIISSVHEHAPSCGRSAGWQSTRPPPAAATTTSRCSSISTRPAWCSSSKARAPRRSLHQPPILLHIAATPQLWPRFASTGARASSRILSTACPRRLSSSTSSTP
jgi:hypothetical protein